MRRRSRRAPSILLTILLTGFDLAGCRSFTLIGSVNLGGGGSPVADATPAEIPPAEPASNPGEKINMACWPDSTAFRAEQRAHGYDRVTWTATAAFLAALAPVKAEHPACPPVGGQ